MPPRLQTDRADSRLFALQSTKSDVAGCRLGMTNNWGSPSGFTYTLNFVKSGEEDRTDERIDLESGATLFVERKALWVGEGGLLGATVDIDDKFNLIVNSKSEEPQRGSAGLTADEVARRAATSTDDER